MVITRNDLILDFPIFTGTAKIKKKHAYYNISAPKKRTPAKKIQTSPFTKQPKLHVSLAEHFIRKFTCVVLRYMLFGRSCIVRNPVSKSDKKFTRARAKQSQFSRVSFSRAGPL